MDMIEMDEAVRIVLAHTEPVDVVALDLMDALGRTLAQDVRSDIDMPPFDKAMMDGYAVVGADVRNASRERPATLGGGRGDSGRDRAPDAGLSGEGGPDYDGRADSGGSGYGGDGGGYGGRGGRDAGEGPGRHRDGGAYCAAGGRRAARSGCA